MGQKTNPNLFRLGIYGSWHSRYQTNDKKLLARWLYEDYIIRKITKKILLEAFVEKVVIVRSKETVTVIPYFVNYGFAYSKNENGLNKIDLLRIELLKALKLSKKVRLRIEVQRVKDPEANASIVAQRIAFNLVNKVHFKYAVNKLKEDAFATNKIKGISILLSGRLGGTALRRADNKLFGSVPFSRIFARIKFAKATAIMSYGKIGIKVAINKGLFPTKRHK